MCKMCDKGEVEDVEHFLLHCNGLVEERKKMVSLMNEIMVGWQEMEGKSKVACVVDKACEKGYKRKRKGCIKNVWIGSKTLTFIVLIIVLYGVNTLVFILLCMKTMCT